MRNLPVGAGLPESRWENESSPLVDTASPSSPLGNRFPRDEPSLFPENALRSLEGMLISDPAAPRALADVLFTSICYLR